MVTREKDKQGIFILPGTSGEIDFVVIGALEEALASYYESGFSDRYFKVVEELLRRGFVLRFFLY